jgi:hypothetical protein
MVECDGSNTTDRGQWWCAIAGRCMMEDITTTGTCGTRTTTKYSCVVLVVVAMKSYHCRHRHRRHATRAPRKISFLVFVVVVVLGFGENELCGCRSVGRADGGA